MYSEMYAADAQSFKRAKRDGILYENIEVVGRVLETEWKGAEPKDLFLIEYDEGRN